MIERAPSLESAPWHWPVRSPVDALSVAIAAQGCEWQSFSPGLRVPANLAEVLSRIVREKVKRGAKMSALAWNQRVAGGALIGLRLHYRDADHEAFFWLTPPRAVRRDPREPALDAAWPMAVYLVGQRWRLVARGGTPAPGWRVDRGLRFASGGRMPPGWLDGGATIH